METAMCRKLYLITGIILIAELLVASIFASASASEPFADDPAIRSTTEHATLESTQEWLERRLRDVGKLKEGQHLKPHQIWRIVDQLENKIENRSLLKVINERKDLLLSEGVPEQTITKVVRGIYHSKTSSFERIVQILKKKNIDIPTKDSATTTSMAAKPSSSR